MLLFGYAFSWIFACSACSSPRPRRRKAIGFIAIFPLTFVSSAFVPVDSMPRGLQGFAEVNPFTIVVDAMRALWLGAPAGNSDLGRGRLVGRADRGLRAAGGLALPARVDGVAA